MGSMQKPQPVSKAASWRSDKKNGTRYRVKRAKQINMHRSDYSPAFAGSDFDRIYFTSTNNHSSGREHSGITGMKNGDIWMSARTSGASGYAPNLQKEI